MNESVESVLIVGTLGGGGIHRYVDEQAEQLDGELSVTVHDMYSDPKGSGPRWTIRSFVLAVVAAIRFLYYSPPDVVHVHTSQRYSFYRASFYVLVAAYGWRRPVVLHVHGSSFDEFLDPDADGGGPLPGPLDGLVGAALARYRSVVLRAADRVIVLSQFWADALAEHVDPAVIRIVPNAVDPDQYDPTYGADPPHLVFVSNLVERKGVGELVDAIDALAARDLPFTATIAGTGPLAPAVDALAARHDEVVAPGYVSEERKRRLLDAGTVFVLPAYAEGLPIAMLEGMAGGNAVVSTRVGAIPEVVGPEHGLLVEPGDADALEAALAELLGDPDRAAAMGRANHRLVRDRYAWSVTAPQLREIYEDVAGEPRVEKAESPKP